VFAVATGPTSRQAAPAQPPPAAAPAPATQPAEAQATQPFRIPRSLEEVDNGQILGFSADLSEVWQPGWGVRSHRHWQPSSTVVAVLVGSQQHSSVRYHPA
jgi:CubicO group peptidase (beta-lactamase class C family)